MKKRLILLLFVLTGYCFAHFPIYVETTDEFGAIAAEWTPVQIGIFPHDKLQLFKENAEVYGLSMGLLLLNQESSVFSFAPLNAQKKNYLLQAGIFTANTYNYGISASALNMTGRNYGLQIGVINLEDNFGYRDSKDKSYPGVTIGLFNSSGSIQFGLLNWNPQGFAPCFPLFNFPVK